jgi:hypothetical protein
MGELKFLIFNIQGLNTRGGPPLSRNGRGLPRETITVSKLEFGATSQQAFNVRFWHLADIPDGRLHVRFWE